jgi:hypothetical protein
VLWDLSSQELRALEQRREAPPVVTFSSPVGGVVLEKQALAGSHVSPGQLLYRIGDLSVVWVEAAVYETDLPLVRQGSSAVVSVDAYPGDSFTGRVTYVYPYIDPQTRTNKVRYAVSNPGGRLKPGMFANVEIHAPGSAALMVPSDAVVDTGIDQTVFVSQGNGYFEPRRVKIGRRSGDQTQVMEGLKEGEHVAAGATFFLDSESQLRAAVQGYAAPTSKDSASSAQRQQQPTITLTTSPNPPRAGDNQFEATAADAAGQPITDAQVVVQFFMAAMPSMNMPASRSEIELQPAGAGVYRGRGEIMSTGRWEVTVSVEKNGQRLGAHTLALVAR